MLPVVASIRPAEIGDVGVVIGATTEPGSGLATLEIARDDGTLVTIDGDWRMIACILADLEGCEVEVVESEGSDFGCPAIRPVAGGRDECDS